MASLFPLARVLMIDIGGSSVKLMVSDRTEMRKFPSGRELTARQMVAQVKAMTRDWEYEVISLAFPGLVRDGHLVREPLNLSGGWLRFNFERAFGRPVRIINDAALQALANYRGGRMLFVGFGTSVGAALVADEVIVPAELGLIPLSRQHTFMSLLTKEARRKYGQKRWQKNVETALLLLQDIFWPADTVIGGGNAKYLDPLPANCRRSSNREGLIGAIRLWEGADLHAQAYGTTWRITPPLRNGRPASAPLAPGALRMP